MKNPVSRAVAAFLLILGEGCRQRQPWLMRLPIKSSSRLARMMSAPRKLHSIMPSISRNPWGLMTSGSRSWPMARALAS